MPSGGNAHEVSVYVLALPVVHQHVRRRPPETGSLALRNHA